MNATELAEAIERLDKALLPGWRIEILFSNPLPKPNFPVRRYEVVAWPSHWKGNVNPADNTEVGGLAPRLKCEDHRLLYAIETVTHWLDERRANYPGVYDD